MAANDRADPAPFSLPMERDAVVAGAGAALLPRSLVDSDVASVAWLAGVGWMAC